SPSLRSTCPAYLIQVTAVCAVTSSAIALENRRSSTFTARSSRIASATRRSRSSFSMLVLRAARHPATADGEFRARMLHFALAAPVAVRLGRQVLAPEVVGHVADGHEHLP